MIPGNGAVNEAYTYFWRPASKVHQRRQPDEVQSTRGVSGAACCHPSKYTSNLHVSIHQNEPNQPLRIGHFTSGEQCDFSVRPMVRAKVHTAFSLQLFFNVCERAIIGRERRCQTTRWTRHPGDPPMVTSLWCGVGPQSAFSAASDSRDATANRSSALKQRTRTPASTLRAARANHNMYVA
jgi:hypothetical protein